MSVLVKMHGGLGNNLFQYALGRLIAEHHGLSLRCVQASESDSFYGHQVDSGPLVTLAGMGKWFPHAPLTIPGDSFDGPVERYELDEGTWDGHTLDLPAILANGKPRQIRLNGYFQRAEYFVPYRAQLREWFTPQGVLTPYDIGPRDVLVNIRRGFDYGILSWTLSVSYCERVLAALPERGQVYVCGTCIDDRVRQRLDQYDPVYYDATPIEHFTFLMRFNRLILSNSTFAWWPAFLSDGSEVYAPRSPNGKAFAFTGWRKVDLHMGQPRYREVTDATLAAFTPFVTTDRAWDECDGVDAPSRDLLAWMRGEGQPVSLDEIRRHHPAGDLRALLVQLLRAGLVAPVTQYAGEG